MADVAQNLRAFLLADASIAALVGASVHQNLVPENRPTPFIWYRQAGVAYEPITDAAAGADPDDYLYDLECVSDDLDEAANLAALVRGRLAYYRGDFGDSTVQAIFVDDHEDDYIPRNEDADAGLHAATLRATVTP